MQSVTHADSEGLKAMSVIRAHGRVWWMAVTILVLITATASALAATTAGLACAAPG